MTTATGSEYVRSISANATGQLSVSGLFFGDTARFGSTQLPTTPDSHAHNAFAAKLAQKHNLLQGQTFLDANLNGTYDTGERSQREIIVRALPDSTYFSSGSLGLYDAVVGLGTHSVSIPNPPRYYTAIAAGPTTASFNSYGNVSTGHDFALQPTPNQQDLTVALTPVSRARAGRALSYRVTARNVGTELSAFPILTLTYDPLLTFVSSSHFVASAPGTLVCALGPMAPGETIDMAVVFQLPLTAPLGHVLSTTVTLDPLNGDLTPTDNAETSTLPVVGPFDPNDLTVSRTTLTLAEVRSGIVPLDYTVRFENVGTDTAFTVTLRDTLPATLLNLGTLELLSASATCIWRLAPSGALTVTFADIRLPAHGTDSVGSRGFARFRVVPLTTLVAGDVIPNQARIYFDFNPPVSTNTVLTLIGPTGLPAAPTALVGGAWPNPATTALRVRVEQPTGAALALELRDALGRAVRTATRPAGAGGAVEHTFELGGLAPGLYVVRAQAGARAWSQRVVVR